MEYWDIYDEKKQRTGRTMKRNDWSMKPDEFHLTVLGVLKRPDGRYLITQRKLDKEWGEDSRDAVIREIREETGIDVSQAAGGYAFSYKRVNPEEKNNYFVDIYKFILDFVDNDVKVQPEEVEGFKIATLEEVQAFAKEGIFLHYDSMKEVFD